MKNLVLPFAVFLLLVTSFSGSAQADIIYFTPSGINTVSQNENLYWDMQSDATSTSTLGAIGDFFLTDHGDFHFFGSGNPGMVLLAGTTTGGDLLSAGDLIGPESTFIFGDIGFAGTTDFEGEMSFGDRGYFGLTFEIGGDTHYGWVDFSEDTSTQTIYGWAYESDAGVGIRAGAIPEPSSTALLGVCLIGAWMRRRRS